MISLDTLVADIKAFIRNWGKYPLGFAKTLPSRHYYLVPIIHKDNCRCARTGGVGYVAVKYYKDTVLILAKEPHAYLNKRKYAKEIILPDQDYRSIVKEGEQDCEDCGRKTINLAYYLEELKDYPIFGLNREDYVKAGYDMSRGICGKCFNARRRVNHE